MDLSQKQRLFMRYLGMLLVWVYKQPGIEVTGGDLFRSYQEAAMNAAKGTGIKKTLHGVRLAVDLNLWLNGVYATNSDAYKPLGEYWKSLDPMNRWGGDFKDKFNRPKPDGNHFSMEHEGVK